MGWTSALDIVRAWETAEWARESRSYRYAAIAERPPAMSATEDEA